MEVKIIVIYSFYALRLSFLLMILRIHPYEKSERGKQKMITPSLNYKGIKNKHVVHVIRLIFHKEQVNI